MELLIVVLLIAVGVAVFSANKPNLKESVIDAALKSNSTTNIAKKAQSEPDLSMLPKQFVVFDLETTGLRAEQHEIIEIAAIRVNRDSNQHDTFTTLVMPTGRISARITELTGIDRKMIKSDGMTLKEALPAFRDFVADLPMVAFNAKFDQAFLRSACAREGQPYFSNPSHCALKLARKAWPGRKSYRLSSICSDAGIALNSEHRALPDCERAMRVYVAAAQTLGSIE